MHVHDFNIVNFYIPTHDSFERILIHILFQKKFSLSQENSSDTWSIPITYTKKSEGNFADLSPKFWLNEGQVEAERTNITFGETEWVLFNLNHSGTQLLCF